MKLSEIHEQVIKAVSEIIGDMRVVDLSNDEVIDDFSVGTAIGHTKEFENREYDKYLFIGYFIDNGFPSYVFATFNEGNNDIGYFEYLTENHMAVWDDDVYTDSDLEFAIDTASKYAAIVLNEE